MTRRNLYAVSRRPHTPYSRTIQENYRILYSWRHTKLRQYAEKDNPDTDILRFFETKFPTIVYIDALKLESDLSYEPALNSDINLEIETSLPEYAQARKEKVTNDKYKGEPDTLDLYINDFKLFKCDTPLEKGFDEFCQRWWMKSEKKELSDGGQRNYVPNDEWKRLELEINNSNQANQECIGEYGPLIDDNDFEYMCDYLLSKNVPFTMKNDEGRLEKRGTSYLERHTNEFLALNKSLTIGQRLAGILA
ncbi:hypothetical protein Tco_0093241 [Tanacetum coccineum]